MLANCRTFMLNLKILRSIEGFIKLQNYKGKDLIVFGKNGDLFKSNCEKVKKVIVPKNLTDCYYDLPVKFTTGKNGLNFKTGYINREGIIVDKSKKMDCNKIHTYQKVSNNKYVSLRSGSNIEIKLENYRTLEMELTKPKI